MILEQFLGNGMSNFFSGICLMEKLVIQSYADVLEVRMYVNVVYMNMLTCIKIYMCFNFSTLLDAANRFLQDNPGMAVWKCESVTKMLNMSKDGTLSYELNTMLRHEATFGFLVYIKGLR